MQQPQNTGIPIQPMGMHPMNMMQHQNYSAPPNNVGNMGGLIQNPYVRNPETNYMQNQGVPQGSQGPLYFSHPQRNMGLSLNPNNPMVPSVGAANNNNNNTNNINPMMGPSSNLALGGIVNQGIAGMIPFNQGTPAGINKGPSENNWPQQSGTLKTAQVDTSNSSNVRRDPRKVRKKTYLNIK